MGKSKRKKVYFKKLEDIADYLIKKIKFDWYNFTSYFGHEEIHLYIKDTEIKHVAIEYDRTKWEYYIYEI